MILFMFIHHIEYNNKPNIAYYTLEFGYILYTSQE